MKLEFDRSLDLPVPAEAAWDFLSQIDKVASCLPGAAITETIDESHYRGAVSVRLGPVNMSFSGTIEVLEKDAATRTLKLAGKGADKGGTSVAEMELTASVVSTGPSTSRLSGQSAVNVNGKAAALGARLMGSVSEQLIKDFFGNLLARLQAEAPAAVSAVASTAPSAAAAPHASGAGAPPPVPEASPAPAASLDGFAFIWNVVKSLIGGLFSGRRASS